MGSNFIKLEKGVYDVTIFVSKTDEPVTGKVEVIVYTILFIEILY